MIALLGAMGEEVADLRRGMALAEAPSPKGCRIYQGEHENRKVLLVETGVGKKRAERATEFVLERYPITALISFGFGGALTDEPKAGDIVLCSTLYEEMGSGGPCYCDADLISLAAQALNGTGVRPMQGSGVTVSRPISEPKAKRALGKTSSARVVDMEGYWIGKIASAKQIPFLAVRVISDTAGDSLPPLERFLGSDGTWRRKSAVLYFLFHPHQLIKLYIFYKNARKASNNLSYFVSRLIPMLSESKQ